MIQPAAPAVAPPVRGGASVAPVVSGIALDSGLFALSLAGFLDAAGKKPADPAASSDAPPGRQDDADPGNGLPATVKRNKNIVDPAFAWFGLPVPPTPLRPPILAPNAPRPMTPIVFTGPPDPTAVPIRVAPAIPGEPVEVPLPTMSPNPLAPAGPPSPLLDTPPVAPVTTAKPAVTSDVSTSTTTVSLPTSAPPIPDRATPPAAQVFAAAIRAAAGQDDRPAAVRRDDDSATLSLQPGPLDTRHTAILATGDAQKAPLDLRQERWPQSMIDRIEHLRDSADAADTRIRLVPDALGTIDVSVKKQGDTVHVHFAAEQAATRAILQDAQPRLAELAEARGLKLGQSGVDSGGTGADPRAPRQPQPAAPPPAPVRVTAEADSTDIRLA